MTYGNYTVAVRPVFANGMYGAWQRVGLTFRGWVSSSFGIEYFSRFESDGTPRLISTVTVRKLPKPTLSFSGQNTSSGYSQHSWGASWAYNSVEARRQYLSHFHITASVVDPKQDRGNIMKGITS